MAVRQPHKRVLRQCIKKHGGKHEAAQEIGISKRYLDMLLKDKLPSRKVFLKIVFANTEKRR